MYKLFHLLPALCCCLTGMGQSEQQQFWALNGSATGFTWDNITLNSRIDNGSGAWDLSTRNWTFNKGISNLLWRPFAAAIFGGNPGTAAAGTITVSGTQTVQSLTFNSAASGNFILTGGTIVNTTGNVTANASAAIGSIMNGTAGLTLSGAGTLTLTGTTSYTGATTVSSGTLLLSNGIANVTTPTLTTPVFIASGATLLADIAGNINLSGAISGAGSLGITTVGAQTFRIYGNNSGFTGNFSEPSGSRGLMWSDNGGAGNAANTGSAAAAWNLSGSFGVIETAGAATPVVPLGSLAGTTSTTSLGAFGGSGIKTFQIGALNTGTGYAGAIQDNPLGNGTPVVALIKVGSAILTLSGSSTYSGITTVSAGILSFTTAVPSSGIWDISVNATSAPTASTSGSMKLPASPGLSGKTINIILTGASTGFTWQAMSWTGTATSTPTLQINGTTVVSGAASGGTTVTYTSTSGITVHR